MAKYKKKYTDIEAIIWDGKVKTICDFLFGMPLISWKCAMKRGDASIIITNCNGERFCKLGDYIVKTPTGCVYPLSPESFHMSYELIKE